MQWNAEWRGAGAAVTFSMRRNAGYAAGGDNTLAKLKFDIFSGELDKNAVWLETVDGLAEAQKRMQEIATRKPGVYFIFSSGDRSVVAKLETT